MVGVGCVDVWVFDMGNIGNILIGEFRIILNMFGDIIWVLVCSFDGEIIYVVVFNFGNCIMVLIDDWENGDILDKVLFFENVEGV